MFNTAPNQMPNPLKISPKKLMVRTQFSYNNVKTSLFYRISLTYCFSFDIDSDRSANGTPGSTPQASKSSTSPAAQKPQKVRPVNRTPIGDGLRVEPLDDPYRERIRNMLYSALAFGNDISTYFFFSFF